MTDNLDVSQSDFSTIRANLVTFLQNQSTLTDYNFEGAAISVLLDILAYNTHYAAAHANLVFSETFLDSANQRGSVVSRAKEMGYTTTSPTAATATISLAFTVTGNPASYTVPKGTNFTSSVNGTNYNFTLDHDCVISNVGNTFTQQINIYQGIFNTFIYTVNTSDSSQRFTIPTLTPDNNFTTVIWQSSSSSNVLVPFSYIADVEIGTLNEASTVYFLKESFDGYYDVYFGDGVIGQEMQNNNQISISYLITNGSVANGAQTFALGSTLAGTNNVSITTVSPANGGADIETTDSVKYLAPFYYASQGRAVTVSDYIALLKTNYTSIEDVVVWGGELNNPPYYGRVFIAVKPQTEVTLTAQEKTAIENDIISKYNIVSITPVLVDPDYINVAVNTVVTYDSSKYSISSNINIGDLVNTAITNYFNLQVNKFGQTLYYSGLVNAITAASNLILDAIVNITLTKETQIAPGINSSYTFNFNNALYPGSLGSNGIQISGTNYLIMDIPQGSLPYQTGNLAIYYVNGQNQNVYLTQTAGTVNYNTGVVQINNLTINLIPSDPILNHLQITVAPGSTANPSLPEQVYIDQNVYTNGQNQIITLAEANITVVPSS